MKCARGVASCAASSGGGRYPKGSHRLIVDGKVTGGCLLCLLRCYYVRMWQGVSCSVYLRCGQRVNARRSVQYSDRIQGSTIVESEEKWLDKRELRPRSRVSTVWTIQIGGRPNSQEKEMVQADAWAEPSLKKECAHRWSQRMGRHRPV